MIFVLTNSQLLRLLQERLEELLAEKQRHILQMQEEENMKQLKLENEKRIKKKEAQRAQDELERQRILQKRQNDIKLKEIEEQRKKEKKEEEKREKNRQKQLAEEIREKKQVEDEERRRVNLIEKLKASRRKMDLGVSGKDSTTSHYTKPNLSTYNAIPRLPSQGNSSGHGVDAAGSETMSSLWRKTKTAHNTAKGILSSMNARSDGGQSSESHISFGSGNIRPSASIGILRAAVIEQPSLKNIPTDSSEGAESIKNIRDRTEKCDEAKTVTLDEMDNNLDADGRDRLGSSRSSVFHQYTSTGTLQAPKLISSTTRNSTKTDTMSALWKVSKQDAGSIPQALRWIQTPDLATGKDRFSNKHQRGLEVNTKGVKWRLYCR